MKRTFCITLLLFSLLAISTQKAHATHVMGMDVTWKCKGNDSFEIKLVVYRRCTDGAAALDLSTNPFTLAGDSCNDTTKIPRFLRSYLKEDITPLCNSAQKICPISGGTGTSTPSIPFGVEKHTIVYMVYLGAKTNNCCWYRFRWQLCCRNSNISTGYADADFYSEAWLNKCLTACNNGPEFFNPPMIIACAGQDVVYNHGVQESDGDSLSYSMAAPSGGSYASPWSYTYPLTCLGGNNPDPNANPPTGFNLDAMNGNISFRPMQVQITVLKIMVTEWRKDSNGIYVIIGKTARDMQFGIIQNCNNKLPSITGPYSYTACAGVELCITLNTSDADISDSTTIYWNKGIKMATWNDNNGSAKKATGTFCWTPTQSDISSIPYYFTATTHDNHCPMIGKTTRSIAITVNQGPSGSRSYRNINCHLVEFKINSAPTGALIKWYLPKLIGSSSTDSVASNAKVFQYSFPSGGKYLIKSSVSFNTCTKVYIDTMVIDSIKVSNITLQGNSLLCPSEFTSILSDSNINYQWYNDTTLIPGETARLLTTGKTGKYKVRTYSNNCFLESNTIDVFEIAKPKANKNSPLCQGDTVLYNAMGRNGSTYQWFLNVNAIPNETTNTLRAGQNGIYYCKVTHPDCIVQTNSDTLVFLSSPAKPVLMMNNGTLYCSTITSTYQWFLDSLLISGASASAYFPTKSGVYSVKIISPNGCSAFSDPYSYNVGLIVNKLASTIKVTPNPFGSELKIETTGLKNTISIKLFDVQSRLISVHNGVRDALIINTGSIESGLYLLEITDGENRLVYKLQKR